MGKSLGKTLGPITLTFYAVGMILGAGIYSVVGEASGLAGQSLWVSFALAAVAALLTGISYAELATMFPEAGAEVVYLHETFPEAKWAPPIFGAALVLSKVGTAATVSIAFAGYLQSFVGAPILVVAIAFLGLVTIVNVIGMRESTAVNVVLTLIELGGLVLVVVVAMLFTDFGADAELTFSSGVLPATALVFFAFLGFEEIANLAEESRDPAKHLPIAIFVAVAITAVVYVLVGLSVTSLAEPGSLAGNEGPLVQAVAEAAPDLRWVMAVAALIATANTGLIAVIATSRLVFGMARRKDLPEVFTKTHSRRKTPWVAALLVLGLALALLPIGGVDALASVTSLAALLAFIVVHVCLIGQRLRHPRKKRPFRVPLAIGKVPVLPIVGIIVAAVLMTQFEPVTYLAGGVTLALGVVLYFVQRRATSGAKRSTKRHDA